MSRKYCTVYDRTLRDDKYSKSFTRLPYDKCAYQDRVRRGVFPGKYKVDTNQIYNSEHMFPGVGINDAGFGVSHPHLDSVAPKNELVDIESYLSNRNIPASDCPELGANLKTLKSGKFKHPKKGKEKGFLTPTQSRLEYPLPQTRGIAVDRFHYTHHDPQAHIFWDFSRNTTREAKDNYVPEYDEPIDVDKYQPNKGKSVNMDPSRGCYAKGLKIVPPY